MSVRPVVLKVGGAALEAPGALPQLARAVADLIAAQRAAARLAANGEQGAAGSGPADGTGASADVPADGNAADGAQGAAAEPARLIVAHGGGAPLSAWSRRLGYEPRFVDGVRVTSDAEMELADMVLAGAVNTAIVRALVAAGVPAVGITGGDGGLITGAPVAAPDGAPSRTARPASVNGALVNALLGAGFVPVVASVASDAHGGAVNINADDAAQAVAEAVRAAALVFVSDVDGVRDSTGRVIPTITPGEIEPLIDAGVVAGGMAAKVRAAARALRAGVGRVVIGALSPADADASGNSTGAPRSEAAGQASASLVAVVAGRAGTTIREEQ